MPRFLALDPGKFGSNVAKMTDMENAELETLIPAWVNGRLTPVGKLAAHQLGYRHKAVSVFVMSGTKTLIQQRALNKYHTPGLWANTCCTHPYWDEDPLTCANRRLQQELGVSGLKPQHRDQIEYRADVGNELIEHEVVDLYTAQADQSLSIAPNPDEVMAYEWIELEHLKDKVLTQPEMFTPWLKIYLAEHSDRIFTASA